MICPTLHCHNPGKRVNYGWCDACSFDVECGLERHLVEAQYLANATQRAWIVAEVHPTCATAKRARKLGKTAYTTCDAKYAECMIADGYTITRWFHPSENEALPSSTISP